MIGLSLSARQQFREALFIGKVRKWQELAALALAANGMQTQACRCAVCGSILGGEPLLLIPLSGPHDP